VESIVLNAREWTIKDVALVDELKERREKETLFAQTIAKLLLLFSSSHPFWPFSPFHAQNRLQLESSGTDSRQHD